MERKVNAALTFHGLRREVERGQPVRYVLLLFTPKGLPREVELTPKEIGVLARQAVGLLAQELDLRDST